ncbi:MAG: hypothetical protein J6X71_04340 [Bacteroidales bacterium]|nr:hypothetical protein [Bacteroidales bacterium]
MEPFFIKVLGEIKAEDDTPQYALDWVCGSIGGDIMSPVFVYNEKEHIVESDLILNSKVRSVPYAFYITDKGICGGNIVAGSGIGGAYAYFNESLSSITDRLSLKLDNRISETVFNALYVETFSTLELFLADTLLSLIFSNEECYNNAVTFYIKESGRTKEIKKEDLIDKVHTFFFKNIVYHSFSRVSRAFFLITGKKLPQAKELNILLHLRHNIVHRHSMDGFSRMRVTSATKESVEQLLQTVRAFSQSLMESLSK